MKNKLDNVYMDVNIIVSYLRTNCFNHVWDKVDYRVKINLEPDIDLWVNIRRLIIINIKNTKEFKILSPQTIKNFIKEVI